MNVNVAQIREDEGLSVHHVYAEGELGLGGAETRINGRPVLDLRATRNNERVELTGRIRADVEFNCDRCLEPINIPVEQSFDLVYVPPLGTGEETALGEDDLSIAFYRDDNIDLDDVAREQIELALPMGRFCKDDCKGLCPACGANLNQQSCGCGAQPVDPRWAALKDLKINNN